MTDKIAVTIDGKAVEIEPGDTILAAAHSAKVEIPVLCYFAHTTSNGLCRLCVVEVEGTRGLQASCVTVPRAGAVIHTHSEQVLRARRTILELLAATVDLSESPDLQRLMVEYRADPHRFEDGANRRVPLIEDNPVYIRDYAKCVLCWRCVQVCAEDAQYTFAIDFKGRGFHTSIATFYDRPIPATTCVFCGQCVGVCPTGALKAKREYLLETGMSPADVLEQTRVRGKGKRSIVGPRLDAE